MMTRVRESVAVGGAGIAGAAVPHAWGLAGQPVHVFDKARGLGGRLATRRVEWVDRQGRVATTRLHHGALGVTASNPAFQAFADLALRTGWLAEWKPSRRRASFSQWWTRASRGQNSAADLLATQEVSPS